MMELSETSSPYLSLPKNIQKNILKEYNLDDDARLNEAINNLQEWLQKQNHILKKDYPRIYYERTLMQCKGSIERAKKLIDRLATMKTLLPKFFVSTNLKTIFSMDLALMVPLPVITEDFYRILIIKVHNKPLKPEAILMFYQFVLVLAEYLKAHDYVKGFIIIDDFRDTNIMDIVTNMNLTEYQQIMNILVEGIGARIKSFIILTESKAIEVLVKTVKHFMSDKMNKRIHVIPKLEDIQKDIPVELWPAEYGGKQKSLYELWDYWKNELNSEDHQQYVQMMAKAGTDESLRISCQFNTEYMGMPGSFTHLNVD